MSLYLEFDPHAWYMGFAIKHDKNYNDPCNFTRYTTDSKICTVHDHRTHPGDKNCEGYAPKWSAYTDNGNTYRIDELEAGTLAELRRLIREYHIKQHNGYAERMEKRAAK